MRTSAQGLFNMMILGLGALAANTICPYLMQKVFTENGITNFRSLFLVPMGVALLAAIALAALFHPPKKETVQVRGEPVAAH